MKKLFSLVAAVLVAISTMAADKEKVAKAPQQTIDGMLNTTLQLNTTPEKANGFTQAKLIQFAYAQVGFELPEDALHLQDQGIQIAKAKKIQVGDIVYFSDGTMGMVYKIQDDGTFSFVQVVNDQVMITSSTGLTFKTARRITSDKELKKLRDEYEAEQKAIAKAQAQAAKAQANAEKEAAKAAKAQADAEKAAQKAQEKIDKANADAAKAQQKADKANKKLDDLNNNANK